MIGGNTTRATGEHNVSCFVVPISLCSRVYVQFWVIFLDAVASRTDSTPDLIAGASHTGQTRNHFLRPALTWNNCCVQSWKAWRKLRKSKNTFAPRNCIGSSELHRITVPQPPRLHLFCKEYRRPPFLIDKKWIKGNLRRQTYKRAYPTNTSTQTQTSSYPLHYYPLHYT